VSTVLKVLDEFLMPRFGEARDHDRFRHRHDKRKYVMRRFFMFVGVVAFALHAVMDYQVGQEVAAELLLYRALASSGMLLVALYFASPRREFCDNNVIALYLAVGIVGVLAMCMTIPGVPAGIYPLGLFVVLAFGGVVLSLPTKHTAIIALLTYIVYWGTVTVTVLPPFAIPVIFFLLTVSFISIVTGALVNERAARLEWLAENKLYASNERLADLNIELEASRHKAVQAMDEAIMARNVQSDFIASMSHELRTPLNAVIGFSGLIKSEMFGPVGDEYIGYVGDIETAGKSLLVHVNDLLDVQRLRTGKMSWNPTQFEMHAALQAAIALCYIDSQKADVKIFMRPSDTETVLFGDIDRLTQALVNLLINAVKFSSPGQTVTLKSECRSNGDCAISVTDEGCGIADDDLEKILSPFAQGGSTDVAIANDGLGLGLSIVQGIVSKFSAEFEVKSEVGVGTTATIVLPSASVSYDVIGTGQQVSA